MKNIIYKIFIKQTYLRGGHCEGIFNIYNNICHNTYISRIFCKKICKKCCRFFVAGRKLNSKLLCTTLIAANIGAGSTVGITGIAYKYGVSSYWWIFMSAIGTAVLAFW